MIKNNITIKLFIFLISFSLKAYSFSSSPYLIAKSAILLHDFSTASKYYAKYDFYDFDINNLEKKLIAFVNTDKLLKASVIAKQIIDLDINNQTAWIVYLANAKLNNDLSVFNSFEKLDKNNEFDIINFVFYDNNMLKQSNDDIAKAFFSITPTLIENNLHQVENYDYLIFMDGDDLLYPEALQKINDIVINKKPDLIQLAGCTQMNIINKLNNVIKTLVQ